MGSVGDYVLLVLKQFAGGPGPVENNLVRFGLAAILWAALFIVSWSRQRSQDLSREKLLVWGFGLAFIREIYMFSLMSWRIITNNVSVQTCDVIEPIEHALAMVAIVVTAGAFIRYILDDPKISRRYIQIGVGIAALSLIYTALTWPATLAAVPTIKFHQTWTAWLFHLPLSAIIVVAIFLLRRKQGWLRNIVSIALGFYFLSEFLFLLNYSTQRTFANILCPIGNSFHILAIPILGFVYLHEQSIEKERAEEALKAYRDQLEDLVTKRTAELTAVNATFNKQLQLAAALAERQRIAADIHDGLAQTLGLLGLQVDQANEMIVEGKGAAAIQTMQEIRKAVAYAFTEVRSSIASLNDTPRPPAPLQDSLRNLFAQFSNEGRETLEFVDKMPGDLVLPRQISIQVLPIVQETLQNIKRHAQANHVRALLEPLDAEVRIIIEDDGCGFDLNASHPDDGHFGLSIIRARVERIAGNLQIDSKPGQGTRVCLRWPLKTDDNYPHSGPNLESTGSN